MTLLKRNITQKMAFKPFEIIEMLFELFNMLFLYGKLTIFWFMNWRRLFHTFYSVSHNIPTNKYLVKLNFIYCLVNGWDFIFFMSQCWTVSLKLEKSIYRFVIILVYIDQPSTIDSFVWSGHMLDTVIKAREKHFQVRKGFIGIEHIFLKLDSSKFCFILIINNYVH